MISSTRNSRGQSIVGRFVVSLTLGLMVLAVGATSAFATTGTSTGGAACKVTYGGRITAANGDKATFGGNANSAGLSGSARFRDHGPAAATKVKSTAVSAVTCSVDGTAASILGTATIDGVGAVAYQIDVTDLGEPGRADTYQLQLSTGYDSGAQLLLGGNVQIHKGR